MFGSVVRQCCPDPCATLCVVAASGLWSPVFAHRGGWDEILYVALPIAVLAAVLWLANRRAKALLSADRDKPVSSADKDKPQVAADED